MSIRLYRMTQYLHDYSRNAIARARIGLTLNHLSALRSFSSKSIGAKFTSDYKIYATDGVKVISYFHDIPLNLDTSLCTATMVVEVPRWSNAQFEIDTKTPGNPIVQDVKNGKVRFVKNLFPYHGYIHNYGALPQTWENPKQKSNIDGLIGDGDPLDVCEIGSEILATGSTSTIKILGSLALVDDGELDWKVIVINTKDPLADLIHDIKDVQAVLPGLLDATREWFADYKLPDGKPKNKFALEGQFRGLQETLEVVIECHESWKKLVSGEIDASEFATETVTLQGRPKYVESFSFQSDVMESKAEEDATIPKEISSIYFRTKEN